MQSMHPLGTEELVSSLTPSRYVFLKHPLSLSYLCYRHCAMLDPIRIVFMIMWKTSNNITRAIIFHQPPEFVKWRLIWENVIQGCHNNGKHSKI